jgi:hypothetical protein
MNTLTSIKGGIVDTRDLHRCRLFTIRTETREGSRGTVVEMRARESESKIVRPKSMIKSNKITLGPFQRATTGERQFRCLAEYL